MITIEERATLNLEYERDFLGNDLSENIISGEQRFRKFMEE